jgi:AcrR family transcriptional regulator
MSRRPYCSPAREAAASETRARIVSVARGLLAADPYVPFSLEAVAKAAGVTRLTVYHQFGGRRALMEAVFDELAAQAGLGQRLGEAAAEPDPRAGIVRAIEVFCGFWSSGPAAHLRLSSATAADPELAESLRDRNERRRGLLAVIVERLAKAGDVRADAAKDLVDVLFAVTSFHVFAELSRDRTPEAACALVLAMAEDALRRASGRTGP